MIIQFITCTMATFFTSILFKVPQKARLSCSLLGGFGYVFMVMLDSATNNPMISYFIATLIITVGSEILARLLKMPATVFTVPAIIALVPGIKLYESMSLLMQNDLQAIKSTAEALQSVLGMAMAMVLTSSLTRDINHLLTAILKKLKIH